jgi:DNA-binding response OmpR family regulator
MILIVAEQIKFLKEFEREILFAFNNEIIIAENQKSALEAALTRNPDLIFIESQAASFSCGSLISIIRQSACTSPIILLTTETTNEIIELLRLGANDFITLPIDIQRAREVIERVKDNSRNRLEQERNHQKLIQDEAVRITLTTLSHHLNNYLTALDGDLVLLHESLQNAEPLINQLEILKKSEHELKCIKTVIDVLVNTKSIKLKDYDDSATMIDIDAQLMAGLKSIADSGRINIAEG